MVPSLERKNSSGNTVWNRKQKPVSAKVQPLVWNIDMGPADTPKGLDKQHSIDLELK